MDQDNNQKQPFSLDPDTAIATWWVTWEALGVALAEIGKRYPDDRWKPELRDKMLFLFEQGTISEQESGQGVMHPGIAPHLKNFDPGSLQDGIRAVEAALDRIVYKTGA